MNTKVNNRNKEILDERMCLKKIKTDKEAIFWNNNIWNTNEVHKIKLLEKMEVSEYER